MTFVVDTHPPWIYVLISYVKEIFFLTASLTECETTPVNSVQCPTCAAS